MTISEKKIKPPPWNCVISGRKEKGGFEIFHTLIYREQIKVCNVLFVYLEKWLLHPQSASSSMKMHIWLDSATLTAKAAYRASVKEGRRRLAFCWQTLSFRLLMSYTWLILQPGSLSASKVSGGGKTNRPAGWQRMKKLPPLCPLGSLERWLTPKVPFCKNCPLKNWKRYGRLATTPHGPSQ